MASNNNGRLNEAEFKRYMIDRLDSMATSLQDIGKGMHDFKTEYYEHIHKNIKHFHDEEASLKWRMAKIELSHKMFKAQVFGGITAVIGIIEIARQMFEK